MDPFKFNPDFTLGFILGVVVVYVLPSVLEFFDEEKEKKRKAAIRRKKRK